jgi:hypothetical protein
LKPGTEVFYLVVQSFDAPPFVWNVGLVYYQSCYLFGGESLLYGFLASCSIVVTTYMYFPPVNAWRLAFVHVGVRGWIAVVQTQYLVLVCPLQQIVHKGCNRLDEYTYFIRTI